MVLQKAFSTLGYPDEVSQPLDADHHQVCKYPSPNDPNYKSVKSVLKTLVSKFRASGKLQIISAFLVDCGHCAESPGFVQKVCAKYNR
jgi:hypothetical protein